MTTLVPLPEPAGWSTGDAAGAMTGSKPSDCIMVKAALYPPAWPTLMRKSRLLKPISEPLFHLPKWPWPPHLNGRMKTFRIGVDVEQELRQGSAGAVDHA